MGGSAAEFFPSGTVPTVTETNEAEKTLRDRLEDAFWARHANPLSSGTRILAFPLLMWVLYRRDGRLLLATVAFVAVNPVLFPPPARTDWYPSRIVLAEREWIADGNETTGLDYPNVLNLLNVPVTLCALASAIRRDPVGTAVGTLCVMALTLRWTNAILRETGVTGEGPADVPSDAADDSLSS